MEEKVIKRWRIHEHPLILKENVCMEERVNCFVCGNPVANLELAYVCMEEDCISRGRRVILHKKCGELPDEIRHSRHPHHSMFLNNLYSPRARCDLCHRSLYSLFGYRCPICDFDVDITCKKVGIDALLEDKEELQHPSHPHHPLTLMRKPAFSFYCDGCGAQDVDMAYICSTCEIWVHKTCASLPLVYECRHHHHRLSLAFSFPEKHLINLFNDRCDVCYKYFDRTCWVYYCDDCRYFVHLKCVGSTPQPNLIEDDDDDVIQFPLYAEKISNKLITPFVMREKGDDNISIPIPVPDTSTTTSSNSIFVFKYHEHPLSLVWESEAEAADDELKICDVCVSPITSHPYYMCSAYANCTYFIHYICCFLPNTLHPNSLLYGYCRRYMSSDKNHNFTLYAPNSKSKGRDAISYWWCGLCGCVTNGMGYKCDDCRMKIDVKCASLPTIIRHAYHPHHKPLLLTRRTPQEQGFQTIMCRVCYYILDDIAYCCSEDECDFALDFKCVMLPKSVREPEWDKHPLLLMSDASLDHPSDFFCEFCEEEMNPNDWMYHCRQCDVSFHLDCSETGSGRYRNVKLGGQYELDGIHRNHPLTFTYITLKRRCNECHRNVYAYVGLECESCYYVVCSSCGRKELEKN